jgi:hypothetical protein
VICFDVSFNGEHFCTAGVGDDGVLNTMLSRGDAPGSPRKGRERNRGVDLNIGGLNGRVQTDWIDGFRKLGVGDSVTIRIVESESADPPLRKKPQDKDPHTECSFCGLAGNKFRRMVPGPVVSICNECVEACQQFISTLP